jgi:hypothetical protein
VDSALTSSVDLIGSNVLASGVVRGSSSVTTVSRAVGAVDLAVFAGACNVLAASMTVILA